MYSCQVPPLAWTNWEAGLSNKRANKTTHATRYLPSLYRCLEDRKSTRLNSSHLVISYAVFCLKKKSTHPGRDPRLFVLGEVQRGRQRRSGARNKTANQTESDIRHIPHRLRMISGLARTSCCIR